MSWVSVNKNLSVQKRWNNKWIIEFLTNPLCINSFILISVHLHRIIWLKVCILCGCLFSCWWWGKSSIAFNTIPHNTLCHLLSISIQRWKQVICINNKANCMLSCSSSSLVSFSLTFSPSTREAFAISAAAAVFSNLPPVCSISWFWAHNRRRLKLSWVGGMVVLLLSACLSSFALP